MEISFAMYDRLKVNQEDLNDTRILEYDLLLV